MQKQPEAISSVKLFWVNFFFFPSPFSSPWKVVITQEAMGPWLQRWAEREKQRQLPERVGVLSRDGLVLHVHFRTENMWW